MTTLLNLTSEEIAIVLQDYPKYKCTVCSSCRQPLPEEKLILKIISYPTIFSPTEYEHTCPYCNNVVELEYETIEEFNDHFYN